MKLVKAINICPCVFRLMCIIITSWHWVGDFQQNPMAHWSTFCFQHIRIIVMATANVIVYVYINKKSTVHIFCLIFNKMNEIFIKIPIKLSHQFRHFTIIIVIFLSAKHNIWLNLNIFFFDPCNPVFGAIKYLPLDHNKLT